VAIHKDKSLLSADELRQHAEEQLQGRAAEPHSLRTNDETQRLVHELQVHQAELEIQNEELRHARESGALFALSQPYCRRSDREPTSEAL
jgi:hypothetical protein